MIRVLPAFVLLATVLPASAQDAKVTYDDHVQPVLRARCFGCHNLDKKSGGLDLTNYTALMQGGSSGDAVEPGDSSLSYLWLLVNHESQPNMPPNSPKLPEKELATIKAWIDGGVLENASSKAKVSNKPKFEMSLAGAPTGRPEVPPMPWRLSLNPVVHTEQTDAVTAIATNPWSPLVAVAGQHQVLLYHAADGKLLGVLPFPEGRAQVLRFSRNGSLLLAGGGQGALEGRVVLWNVKTGERVAEIGDEFDEVLAADISADQQLVALGGPNRIVRVHSIATGEVVYSIKKHTDWISALEFSPDGVLLATADRNGGVHVWEAATGREYLTLNGHTGGVPGVSWRADGNILATASEDGSVKLWEMNNGSAVKSWGAHGGGALSVEFARDGRIVSCGRDKTVKLWDQNGAQQRAFPAFGDIALQVTFSDETNHVIAGDWSGRVLGWKADDGQQVADFSVNPPELDQRLKDAEAALASVEAEYQKLDAAAKAAEAEAAKQKAALEAAMKAVDEKTKLIADTTNAMNVAKAEAAKQTAAKDAAAKQVAAVEPLVPLLVESHGKANAALEKSPADEKLKALVATAKGQVDEKTAALNGAKNAMNEAGKALDAANAKVAETTKTLAEATQTLEVAKKSVADLTPVVKTATEKATADRNAANAVAPQRTAAKQRVDEAREAITFAAELEKLATKRDERRPLAEAVVAAEEATNSVAATLAESQSQLATVTKLHEEAKAALAGTVTGMQKVTAERDAYTKTATDVAGALTPLGESLKKATEAAAKLPNDESLKQVVVTLNAEVEAKTKVMNDAKTAAADRAGQLEKLIAAKAQQEKAVAEAGAAMANATKMVQETTTARDQMVAKVEAAKESLAKFDAELKQVEDKVQAMRTPEATGDATADATKS